MFSPSRAAWFALASFLCAVNCSASPNSELHQLVLSRYRDILIEEPRRDCGPLDEDSIRESVETLASDGSWPDIDYANDHPSGWPSVRHLLRMVALAHVAETPSNPLHSDPTIYPALHKSLDYWLQHRPQCSNWWWNEIGVPRVVRDVVVLCGDELDDEQRRAALQVVRQHDLRGTGANLMWSAELAIHYACLTGNDKYLERAIASTWQEVKDNGREGIQEDGSYFQHGPRLHNFSYGKSYLRIAVELAWQFHDTPLAMPAEKRALFTKYLLEGPQWMVRGIHTAPGTIDRAFARKGRLTNSDLRHELKYWELLEPQRRAEVEQFRLRQEGQVPPLVGHRHWRIGNFTTHHRHDATVFLKTASSRTRITERINGENLKGTPYLCGGDCYLIRDGNEYNGLQPVLDWRHLPGVTVLDDEADRTKLDAKQPFVGAVSDQASGLTVMPYARKRGDRQVLSVNKAWFFHDDLVVCLLAGWDTQHQSGAVTSLDQCRFRGVATTGSPRGPAAALNTTECQLEPGQWLLHNGFGYMPLDDDALWVRAGDQTGRWSDINSRYSQEDDPPVTEPVLNVRLHHPSPLRATGYALVLNADTRKLQLLAQQPTWNVLSNTKQLQAVGFENGPTLIAFYEPGEVADVAVDQPCLVMVRGDTAYVCDPTHQGGSLVLRHQGQDYPVQTPPDGRVATIELR